jgi:hypothetical protein
LELFSLEEKATQLPGGLFDCIREWMLLFVTPELLAADPNAINISFLLSGIFISISHS